jgi:alcohol dehydrogenase class IV
MPHGLAVGISNPYVIQFSSRDATERYGDIAHAVGIKDESPQKATDMLVESIRKLMVHLRTPLSLREAGISQNAFEQNIESLIEQTNRSTCAFMNPRVPDIEEIRKLLAYMHEGKDVDF